MFPEVKVNPCLLLFCEHQVQERVRESRLRVLSHVINVTLQKAFSARLGSRVESQLPTTVKVKCFLMKLKRAPAMWFSHLNHMG
jgi:hypothetical protein